MRIFTRGIPAKRKIALIFLLAILLPSVVVGYLSFSTFARRRESVRRILESNLWVSGEAALLSFETALFDLEKQALEPQKFTRLLPQDNAGRPAFIDFQEGSGPAGRRFLLDGDLKIVFPRTGNETAAFPEKAAAPPDERFARDIRDAELLEHTRKNYARAAGLFRHCVQNAPSKANQAKAMEGLGRCLLAAGINEEAYLVYSELAADLGQLLNTAGHPYGVTAAFQLHEIGRRQRQEEQSLQVLLDAYRGIHEGRWLLNLAARDFFIGEIEAVFEKSLDDKKFPGLHKSWREIRRQPSAFHEALLFSDFLSREVIPNLEERLKLRRLTGEAQAGRIIVTHEENFCLISYAALSSLQPGEDYYGGYCWDLGALKERVLPGILEGMKKDSGLVFQISDENTKDAPGTHNTPLLANAVALSLRQFPLPWKFTVTQPELEELERTAVRETFLYGLLLGVIVALMILGAVLIARDISRETETTRLKTEFVHNISHELKTPLTLIRLYGETLQRKDDLEDGQKREAYQIITKESERLSHLINNILDFSRIEMGRKEFNFKTGNLADTISETLESYRYHLEKKGFAVQEEISPEMPEMAFDHEAMASVLVNLLSNAMKFSPEKKEVTVRLFCQDGNAVLQVEDKGIGIPPKDLSKIFQRFYRSDQEVVSETRGSGLGLTIVQHIVEAHGGRIRVSSASGKGSVFSVILPIRRTGAIRP
jgi:signal transduction histidine kinase